MYIKDYLTQEQIDQIYSITKKSNKKRHYKNKSQDRKEKNHSIN